MRHLGESSIRHPYKRLMSDVRLCPKYINVRSLLPLSRTQPHIAAQNWHLSESDSASLPDEIISFIYNADTAYLGTSYVAPNAEDEKLYPSRLGTNHRGGRAGFVRVRNDGRTLVLPNYAGQLHFVLKTQPLSIVLIY